MSRRIVWPIVKKLYWCFNCNVPILGEKCPRCGSQTHRLPLSDPGDARLALERDFARLRQAYINEFGSETGLRELLGKSSVMLLNKAPYPDEMKEVFVDGVQIGRLYFDPLLRRWRFRLSKVGALRVLQRDPELVKKIVVTKKRYMPMDIIRVNMELRPREQVLLVRPNGKIVGLGYAKGRNRVLVHSWWGDESPDILGYSDRASTVEDVVKANEEFLRIAEARSKKLIAIMYEKTKKPVVVSFSGGKDSLVALHLTLELGLEPVVLFNNTGIELRETVETVYKTVDRFNLKLVEASAGDAFWRCVWFFGPPGRDYRWCCKILKLTPLQRAVKSNWPSGALNVVGQRAFESLDRARSPSVWRLRWAPQLLNISPINYWSQLEVWLYILMKKLSPNPLYFMGYERIGCFLCPASTLAEFVVLEESGREEWIRWLEVLEYWRRRLDMPKEWIEYALWRWTAPARYRTLMAKKLKVVDRVDNWEHYLSKWVSPAILSVERTSSRIEVVLSEEVNIKAIEDQITVVSPAKTHRYGTKLVLEWSTARIEIDGSRIILEYSEDRDVEKLVDVLKLFYRWRNCAGCRSCEYNCPMNVLKIVNGRPRVIDFSRCIRCKLCLYNCPIAEVYVEHIVTPLIFRDPEAWRRKTREHHLEVLKKIKSLLKKLRPDLFPEKAKTEEKPREYASTQSFFDMLEQQ